MSSSRRIQIRSEGGFTLVELLVMMVSGIVVFSGLLAILDVTTRQTTRIVSQVDATQVARTALEKIDQQLHSSCVGGWAPPVQVGSDDDTLIFISASGAAAQPTPYWHEINFTGTTLVQNDYAVVGAPTAPTRGAQIGTQQTLLSRVGQKDLGTPVFQYFRYVAPLASGGLAYEDPDGNEYRMLLVDDQATVPPGATLNGNPVASGTVPVNAPEPQQTPLVDNVTARSPDWTAAVLITLNVSPERGNNVNPNAFGAAAIVSDLINMRLTAVNNHAGDEPNIAPCA
jgi:type II secretory pathway pseudopilin PulG